MKIYGHRGARGLYPENTIKGFEKTIFLGVDGIELDVVMSKDMRLVVSHEPWMNHFFCLTPEGENINIDKEHNIYKFDYKQIKKYDCGTLRNPNFPKQELSKCYKPLLADVFALFRKRTTPNFKVFLEIKSEPEWVGEFQPDYDTYAKTIIDFVTKHTIPGKLIIKSFDSELMNSLNKLDATLNYGFLVENEDNLESNLSKLNFTPTYYNINFEQVNSYLIAELKKKNIKLATWTVNKKKDFERLKSEGVKEIITDYPNLFLNREV